MNGKENEDVDALEILIRKAENGFVVEVNYPSTMVPNPQLDNVQSLFSSIAKAGATAHDNPAGEHDHGAFIKSIGDAITKIGKPGRAIRRAHEEYVFQSMDAMLAFARETFESAAAADQPEAASK